MSFAGAEVHESAHVGPGADIGMGSKVLADAVVHGAQRKSIAKRGMTEEARSQSVPSLVSIFLQVSEVPWYFELAPASGPGPAPAPAPGSPALTTGVH